MAEKDIIEKTLIGYNDVFSDICNGFLFKGEQVVSETQLSDATAHSIFKADGDFHSQERDVAKYWNKSILRTAMFGIENQSSVDSDMPLRVISYDGVAYRLQADTDAPRYPVITIVIYFGKGKWGKNKSLYDVLNIPNKLKPFINNYKILVLEVDQMTEDQVELYHSDFKYVADALA